MQYSYFTGSVNHDRFLSYMKYASLRKEALRRESDNKSHNLDSYLSRVRRRVINVIGTERKMNCQQVEMTENPLRPHSIGSDLQRI